MKVSFHLYKLKPTGTWNEVQRPHPCDGALIKVEYPDGRVGYSDLHPWPSLGDKWLGEQIELLKEGQVTFQAEQSIWMANRDSLARQRGESVLANSPEIQNHFFLAEGLEATGSTLEDAQRQGFKAIKIKVGNDRNKEADLINGFALLFDFKWRLDFNAKLDIFQFTDFWNRLKPEVKNQIEFVEDPTPYKYDDWHAINKFVPIAIDKESSKVDWDEITTPPFNVIIIKPAVQDPDKFLRQCQRLNLKMVISSYLDHPVGAIHAAWIAGEIKQQSPEILLDCGLMSYRAYSYSDFVSLIETQGPVIKNVYGKGVGFDLLWERLAWKPLKP